MGRGTTTETILVISWSGFPEVNGDESVQTRTASDPTVKHIYFPGNKSKMVSSTRMRAVDRDYNPVYNRPMVEDDEPSALQSLLSYMREPADHDFTIEEVYDVLMYHIDQPLQEKMGERPYQAWIHENYLVDDEGYATPTMSLIVEIMMMGGRSSLSSKNN